MSVTLTLKSLEKQDWFKVVKVFFYAAVSLGLSAIPAHFAHDPTYLALTVPINALLVGLRQTVKQEEQTSLAALPVSEQVVVSDVSNAVVPNSLPTEPTTPVTPAL